MSEHEDQMRRAAEFWDSRKAETMRTRWWLSPTIYRHINQKVSGLPLNGPHAGFHHRLAGFAGERPLTKALSIGCGQGSKEMLLIKNGTVEEFHLYEISTERAKAGKIEAESAGIGDRVHFHVGDAFTLCKDKDFDLVYWNNALHHMLDALEAVEWSRDRLKKGGIFAMDDFVGATRFQWSERMLDYAIRYRQSLRPELLRSPNEPSKYVPRILKRPSIDRILAFDPTEAADSEAILPAIRDIFPDAEILHTGGAIYNLALTTILANFEEGGADLTMALLVDDLLCELGENHYAVAFARKM